MMPAAARANLKCGVFQLVKARGFKRGFCYISANKAAAMVFWRRLATVNPLYLQFRSSANSRSSSQFRTSNPLHRSFHGGAGKPTYRPLEQLTLKCCYSSRSGSNGGKNGEKGGDEEGEEKDLFKRKFDNARFQRRAPAADAWDFSAKGDEDEVFGIPGEGEGRVDWKFDEVKDEKWKGFEEEGEVSVEELRQESQGIETQGLQPWDLVGVGKGERDEEEGGVGALAERESTVKAAQQAQLEKEEKELTAQLEGPNRAFGDLIAATGITDVQIESLILMRDLEGIEGLPPLKEIEDTRRAKMEKKSTRGELEQRRQQEIAKARVRKVDEKGRAYGTGRRKCSVAQVWIQPGSGKFIVNGKSFDVYFPLLAHRSDLLSPFVFTKTLGLWDVVSNVNGGGVSGQVGAVRHGISRALQNWEPELRPYLRAAGLLTRDPRMVERKKPGKAKARKSYQWVKR